MLAHAFEEFVNKQNAKYYYGWGGHVKGRKNQSRITVRPPLKHKCRTKQSVTYILKMEQPDSPTRAETQRSDITVWPDKVVSYLNFKNGSAGQSGQSSNTKAGQYYLARQSFSAAVVLGNRL